MDRIKGACHNSDSESPTSNRGSPARSLACPSEICVGQGGTGTGFSPSTVVVLCHFSSTLLTLTHIAFI